MRIVRNILILGAVAMLSGCATQYIRPQPTGRAVVYPATRIDAHVLGASVTDGEVYHGSMRLWERPLFLVGSIVDIPFSLLFDTLYLPYDLWGNKSNNSIQATPQ